MGLVTVELNFHSPDCYQIITGVQHYNAVDASRQGLCRITMHEEGGLMVPGVAAKNAS